MSLEMKLSAFSAPDRSDEADIGCFRKHWLLHKWVEARWVSKGRPGSNSKDFLCVDFELDRGDLEQILAMSRDPTNYLKEMPGSSILESMRGDHEDSVQFATKALELLDAGYRVFYFSW